MTLSRLFALDDAIHAELERRQSSAIATANGREVVEELHTSAATFRLELVNCGKCQRCAGGRPVHGPYWYGYSKSGGKTKSWYIGKKLKETK